MNEEEITARFQTLEARLFAAMCLIRAALHEQPDLLERLKGQQHQMPDALLHSEMTDSQIEEATRSMRVMLGGNS
jgi:hypothetical protein